MSSQTQSSVPNQRKPAPQSVLLLVEDSDDDTLLFVMAVKTAAPWLRVVGVKHYPLGMAYLCNQAPYDEREKHPFPSIIVADLCLGVDSGFRFLTWVRKSFGPALPLIVLSGSMRESDRKTAESLGATAYYTKPPDQSDLRDVVREIATSFLSRNDSGPGA